MSEFTKGEWFFDPETKTVKCDEKLGNRGILRTFVADLRWGCEKENEQKTNANGRLIAAAPEMYQLLQDYVDEYFVSERPNRRELAIKLLLRIDGVEKQAISEKLKPCPFCGEKLELGKGAYYDKRGYSGPLWKRIDERYRVECPQCHASTDEYRTAKKAVEMWNRRANDGI